MDLYQFGLSQIQWICLWHFFPNGYTKTKLLSNIMIWHQKLILKLLSELKKNCFKCKKKKRSHFAIVYLCIFIKCGFHLIIISYSQNRKYCWLICANSVLSSLVQSLGILTGLSKVNHTGRSLPDDTLDLFLC